MIGSNLVKRLVSLNHSVFVIDNLYRGSIENLSYTFSSKDAKVGGIKGLAIRALS